MQHMKVHTWILLKGSYPYDVLKQEATKVDFCLAKVCISNSLVVAVLALKFCTPLPCWL